MKRQADHNNKFNRSQVPFSLYSAHEHSLLKLLTASACSRPPATTVFCIVPFSLKLFCIPGTLIIVCKPAQTWAQVPSHLADGSGKGYKWHVVLVVPWAVPPAELAFSLHAVPSL